MTNDEKTIETCTGEEITEALKLSEDATVAPWHRFNGDVVAIRTCIVALVPGTANPRRQVTSNVDHEPDAMFIARARTLLPKMAAHLAALKAAGAEMVRTFDGPVSTAGETIAAIETLRDLCGSAPVDMVLVPAAELARLRASEEQSKALTAAINARLRSGDAS